VSLSISPVQVSVTLVVLAMLSGCGGEVPKKQPEPVTSKVSEAKPAPAPKEKETVAGPVAPVPSPEASFQYNPSGRRDPFRSIIVVGEKKKSSENLPPLQRMDLSEFRLIGVLWGGFGFNAMLQSSDGKGYPVRVGTHIGMNNGVIRRISINGLTVEENYTDIFGEKKMREFHMELHTEKERPE